jgi:hypothetical protein
LILNWGSAITLVIMLLVLYRRVKTDMIFGPGMVIWPAWVGIVLFRRSADDMARHDETLVPRHST